MPYKDPQRKREWEQQHRLQRIRRRRHLRELEAASENARRDGEPNESGLLWLGVLGGGALAASSPKLAIGAGSLILCLAGVLRKDWKWWALGLLILALGLFFQWNDRETNT